MSDYPAVLPHGALQEVFSGVHFVTGSVRPTFAGQAWQFSRNMTVVAHDGALTLINAVRLDDAGLADLERLGAVAHVIKLGAFHGMDDAFYVDRYQATLWGLAGAEHESGKTSDATLAPGAALPFPDGSLFVFETSSKPEGLILVDRDGGVLIACDSLQNWADVDEFFSEESAATMRQIGFITKANVGPGWLQACTPKPSEFTRLKALPFCHLLSAHGTPLRDTAKDDLAATFQRLFSI